MALVRREVMPQLGSFYYSGPALAHLRQPALGTRTFELRFRNGYVTGIVAGSSLGRFLSYGVHLERFDAGTWVPMPPPEARGRAPAPDGAAGSDPADAGGAGSDPLRHGLQRDRLRGRPGTLLAAVALEVGIVGLPNSGKTTLFNAHPGGRRDHRVCLRRPDKSNVGMATIADERLEEVAALVGAKKVTPAAVRVQDVPGDRPGPPRRPQAGRRAARRRGRLLREPATPTATSRRSKLELLVADTDHVAKRLERVSKQAKSGDAAGPQGGRERWRQILAHLEAGEPLTGWTGELPDELDPLTTKPLLAIVNGPDGIDCKLEAGWPSSPTKRRRRSATGRPPSTRSCAG